MARVEFFAGANRASSALHAEALEMLEEHGSPGEVAGEQLFSGFCRVADSDFEGAAPLLESAYETAQHLDDRWLAALALGGLLRVAC